MFALAIQYLLARAPHVCADIKGVETGATGGIQMDMPEGTEQSDFKLILVQEWCVCGHKAIAWLLTPAVPLH